MLLGGVVTLTPNAIVGDILKIRALLKKVHEHPLWDCYVLPSVLGLAMRTAEQKYDAET